MVRSAMSPENEVFIKYRYPARMVKSSRNWRKKEKLGMG